MSCMNCNSGRDLKPGETCDYCGRSYYSWVSEIDSIRRASDQSFRDRLDNERDDP